VGAAFGLAAVADDLDVTVRLLGTPAEEVGNAAARTC
jgi:metal-dependent amidase/aminoacylase/carboxypeptidase family protein